ncbi:MAG: peptide deformylase, partial [Chloroflexaceae bacterium]|nr:peptide deformylase [Chloroflexaceae bacterium]
MAIRRILRIDNPEDKKILKTKCRPIKLPDAKLRLLVDDMFETMHDANGVGLAAPQVGLPIRLTVIWIPPVYEVDEEGNETNVLRRPEERYTLINPEIIKTSNELLMRNEGCLSLPGWYGDVPRARWVTVEYQDLDGKRHRLRRADGFLGWVLQHEIDHLNGTLFTELIRDLSTLRNIYDEQAIPTDVLGPSNGAV